MKKLFFLFILLSGLNTAAQTEEQLNITTYHPSVKGIYKNLDITERIKFKGLTENPSSGEIGQIIYRSDQDLFYYWKEGEGWKPLNGMNRTELNTIITETVADLNEVVAWVDTAGQTCQNKCQELEAVYCKEAWSCVNESGYIICSGMLPFTQGASAPTGTVPGISYLLKCICMVE